MRKILFAHDRGNQWLIRIFLLYPTLMVHSGFLRKPSACDASTYHISNRVCGENAWQEWENISNSAEEHGVNVEEQRNWKWKQLRFGTGKRISNIVRILMGKCPTTFHLHNIEFYSPNCCLVWLHRKGNDLIWNIEYVQSFANFLFPSARCSFDGNMRDFCSPQRRRHISTTHPESVLHALQTIQDRRRGNLHHHPQTRHYYRNVKLMFEQ